MDQLKMTDWIQSRNNGLALGTDSHNSGRKIGKRAVSDAFADDWGLYENSRRGRKPLGPLSVASNVAGRVSAAAQPAGERNRQRQSSDTPFRIGGPGSSGVADDRLSPQLVQSCKDMRTNIPAPTVALPDDCQKVLSEEQQQVVMSVLSGYSTFFTGPAGSGKSHVLSTILRLNDEVSRRIMDHRKLADVLPAQPMIGISVFRRFFVDMYNSVSPELLLTFCRAVHVVDLIK